MLVIQRKRGESFSVYVPTPAGETEVVVTMLSASGGDVAIGIDAPPEVLVLRDPKFLAAGYRQRYRHAVLSLLQERTQQ
jgi:sRNA-binding carbon storage regulator CsrA